MFVILIGNHCYAEDAVLVMMYSYHVLEEAYLMRIVTFFLACILTAVPVVAQHPNDPSEFELDGNANADVPKQGLTISPYLWGPSLSGTASLGPIDAPVNLPLGELASGIKIGGMGHVQYSHDNLFVYAEAIGAKFGDDEFATFGDQSVKTHAILAETGFGYHHNFALGNESNLQISPYVGIRYVDLKAAINGPQVFLTGRNDWVDPMVGAITRLELSKNWSVIGKLDFGGLSVTDNNYRSVQLGLEFNVTNSLSLVGGYRSTKGKFASDRGLAVDLKGEGPVLGLRYAFEN